MGQEKVITISDDRKFCSFTFDSLVKTSENEMLIVTDNFTNSFN